MDLLEDLRNRSPNRLTKPKLTTPILLRGDSLVSGRERRASGGEHRTEATEGTLRLDGGRFFGGQLGFWAGKTPLEEYRTAVLRVSRATRNPCGPLARF
jgi:hypothetical protein